MPGYMDEAFVFKVSVVLLCFLSLLLPIVLFLVVWLGKIQNRVDSISNGWSVFCKLAASEENLAQGTESRPEVPKNFSNSLVIFNQQVEDSDKSKSWKNISRAFAYAPANDEEDGPHPNEEKSACAPQGEVKEADEESKSQEEIVPDTSISVASYLQIVNENPAIVGISSSERPASDAKLEKKRIYISVTSDDDNDNDDDDEPLLDNNFSAESETGAQQINLKENDSLEDSKGSETGKSECVVFIEENRKQTTDVFIDVPEVKTSMCDELQNGIASQDVERKNANPKVVNSKKVLNEEDRNYTSEIHGNASSKLPEESEDADKEMSPPGEGSKSAVPEETRPIPKPRLSKKNRRRINSEGKGKSAKCASQLDNADETKRHSHASGQEAERQDRTSTVVTVSSGVEQTVQQDTTAPSKTGVKFKGNTTGENEVQVANEVGNPEKKSCTSDEGIPNYESVATPAESVAAEPVNGGKETLTYGYATSQEVTKNSGSSSVISQLQGLLRTNPSESQNLNKEINTTARHETTKFPGENSSPVVRQENNNSNAKIKGKGKRAKRASYPQNPDDTCRYGHDSKQHAMKQGRTSFNEASEFQTTAQQDAKARQKTGALSKSNTRGDNGVKCAKDKQHSLHKPGTSNGGNSEYEVVVTSVSGGKVDPDNKGQGKLTYDYATTQEVTQGDESAGIISQLRGLLHKSSGESQYVDQGSKTIAGYPVVGQEIGSDGKHEENTCHAAAAEPLYQNTREEIYSNVDEEGNDIYSEIPFSDSKIGTSYIEHDVAPNEADNEPFYVNLPFQKDSVNCNGGLFPRNEQGASIYSNRDVIDI